MRGRLGFRRVLLVVLCALGLAPALAQQRDIMETLRADARFTTLVRAIDTAELADTLRGAGPYTVFAPTNAAFDKLPAGTLADLLNRREDLTNLLLYHITPGRLTLAQIGRMTVLTSLQGSGIPVTMQGRATLIGGARVVQADIRASNGIIDAVDTVLTLPLPTAAYAMERDPRFSTMTRAINAAGLQQFFTGTYNITVFAPTNDAFAKIPENELNALMQDVPRLRQVLLYHVVPMRYTAAEVARQRSLVTFLGPPVTITTADGQTRVNGAAIVVPDIGACNGMVHGIDTVLLPPVAGVW